MTRKVSIGFGIAKVVNSDDFHITAALALVNGAQHIVSDAAIPIDCDFYCHCVTPVCTALAKQ